jgi:hypothetical protein
MLNEADWSPYLGPQSIGPLLIDFQIHRGPGELSVVLGVSLRIAVRVVYASPESLDTHPHTILVRAATLLVESQ